MLIHALLLAAAPAFAAPVPASTGRKIDELVSRMTLEEKLGQLEELSGEGGRADGKILAAAGKSLGSTLSLWGAGHANELQRAALGSPLKIPVLVCDDVIHGYRTIFPIPLALASSWDPGLVERAAAVSAAEARAAGVRCTFSPMVDIARDPRWGRVAEGAGEDPFLGSAMARAYVRGYQGSDPSAPGKLVACVKHWVGYGATEGGRDYNTTEISERTLRGVYFPPFKAALDAGALMVMSAFNDLDGVPSTANHFTLTNVLRGEWGFPGFVVSDYTAVRELIAHGVAKDGAQAAQRALQAGVDMEMTSTLYLENLPKLVRAGAVPVAVVDEAVRRVLRVKAAAGLFEAPYADEASEAAAQMTPSSLAEARRAAGRSMVLLKDEGDVLPLSKGLRTLAVIGPLADDQEAMLGSWRGYGEVKDAITIVDGLRRKLPGAEVIAAAGCDVEGDSTAGFAQALAAARRADAVVLALGESASMSGEASARTSLDLPGRQLELAQAVLALGKPTAVVLINGRPLTIGWLAEHAPAILEAWQPGLQAGPALADVLFGDVDPGGKLPMTFPRNVGQIPLYYDHMSTGRPASDADHYTSKYLDSPVTPQFPFGYGLSYTSFRLSGLRLAKRRVRPDEPETVEVRLANVGSRAGDEVVQLYIRRPAASVTRPVRALKGFARVTLEPKESRTLSFSLTPKELGFHGEDMRWSSEPGDVQVFVGTSSVGGLEAAFSIAAP